MNYPVPDLIKKLLCKSVNEKRDTPILWYMLLQKPSRQSLSREGQIQTGQTDSILAVFT